MQFISCSPHLSIHFCLFWLDILRAVINVFSNTVIALNNTHLPCQKPTAVSHQPSRIDLSVGRNPLPQHVDVSTIFSNIDGYSVISGTLYLFAHIIACCHLTWCGVNIPPMRVVTVCGHHAAGWFHVLCSWRSVHKQIEIALMQKSGGERTRNIPNTIRARIFCLLFATKKHTDSKYTEL
jgi:hypothetical protein